MKHYSAFFNKRSRLIQTPTVSGTRTQALPPLDPKTFRRRLEEVLTIQNDFFPCFDWVFPPPLFPQSSGPDSTTELFTEPSVIPGRYSLYLHIPFCKTLCSFCYYPVIPKREPGDKARYVDHLVREMALYRDAVIDQSCESVYIGGGTPTSLDDDQLRKLFAGLREHFRLLNDAEITIESAPGTLPRARVELLRELGVNRISYGIQTLDERLLATMNRFYSVDEAVRELADAVELIGNVNIDTMYGFDGEPEDALEKTLTTFIALGIPSISIYALDKQRSVHEVNYLGPPKDELYRRKIDLFQQAEELLRRTGFVPVLQNIFVKPGRGSYRHQVRRWENLPLVALGLSSMGYAPRRPYQNHKGLKSYYQAIDAGRPPIATVDHLSPDMEMAREVTSLLRFTEVSVPKIQAKYGVRLDRVFADLIDSLTALGYVTHRNGILRMTPKAAYYNNIIPLFFSPDHFKERLLELPEEYLELFPVPQALTRLGATQSAPIAVALDASRKHRVPVATGAGRRWRVPN